MTAADHDTALELKKSIYGLRPSSKNWYNLVHETALTLGFRRSRADRCLYFQTLGDGNVAILLVYVDDMLLVTGSEKLIEQTTNALQQRFQITIDEDPQFFIGFEIKRNWEEKIISLTQVKYIERMLKRFNMQDAYPQNTPMEVGLRLEENENGSDDTEFRSMIGALLYLARGTRPDIAFAVNALSRAQASSTKMEKNYVRRVFRYLVGTKEFALTYTAAGKKLDAYVDASYAPNITVPTKKPDLSKGRSITGYLLRLFADPILWAVKKQTIMATSSTAAEVIAIFDALDNICVAQYIMNEIFHVQEPVTIYEDNTSATRIIMGGEQKNMRSILIKCYAVLEAVENKEIRVENVAAKDQWADALTKALDREKLTRFTSEMFKTAKKTSK